MNFARTIKTLIACAALAVSALAIPTATAHADNCSYSSLTRSNVNLYGYVGYVELMYSAGCHTTEAHFHVDSSFLATHSGWNVAVWISNGRNADSTARTVLVNTRYPNNTSYSDYSSISTSIHGWPSSQFVAGVSWTYNACSGEWGSGWHDYNNGQNFNDGGAYSYSSGCHG